MIVVLLIDVSVFFIHYKFCDSPLHLFANNLLFQLVTYSNLKAC